MLDKAFIEGLDANFPSIHADAKKEVPRIARRIRDVARGDERRAILAAQAWGTAQLWWPYVRSTKLFGNNNRPAYETITQLVLVIDELHGYTPTEAEARDQVKHVVEGAFDVANLKERASELQEEITASSIGASLMAPLLSPAFLFRRARRVPKFMLLSVAGIVLAAYASIPLYTGASISQRAERLAKTRRGQAKLPAGDTNPAPGTTTQHGDGAAPGEGKAPEKGA